MVSSTKLYSTLHFGLYLNFGQTSCIFFNLHQHRHQHRLKDFTFAFDAWFCKMQFDEQARTLEETKKVCQAEKERRCECEEKMNKDKLTIEEQALSMKATTALYV